MRDDIIARVVASLNAGNTPGAIEALRDALGEEPENSLAHALLASALMKQRRIHAARHEAELAVALDPTSDFAFRMRGYVALSSADLGRAQLAFAKAVEIDPTAAENRIAEARLAIARHDLAAAQKAIDQALALDPGDTEAKVIKGRVLAKRGRLGEAEIVAREALASSPEDIDTLCLLGEVRLAQGDGKGAKDLALWALQRNANDETALQLLADVKVKESPLLGLWWRYNAWLARLGAHNAMAVLTLMYVVYFLAQQGLDDFGHASYGTLLTVAWLVFCLYTWSGGAIRERMVKKELEHVRLRPNF